MTDLTNMLLPQPPEPTVEEELANIKSESECMSYEQEICYFGTTMHKYGTGVGWDAQSGSCGKGGGFSFYCG